MTGVPAIVQAIESGKIKCRVYTKKKFHAKAYITHSKLAVVGSSALVGSSNFTFPGLTGKAEVPQRFARGLGFARTGPTIEETVWSLMRALQRGELVQTEGRGANTRYRKMAG